MKNHLPLRALLLPSLLAAGTITSAWAQAPGTALYVNDGSLSGDVFTTAVGSDASGNGSAVAPFATVAQALAQAGPATQTIFIDAGTYAERVVLAKAISLRGAGTAAGQPAHATIFEGGLLPAATQTSETGLRLIVGGGSSSQPLTIAGITFQGYDFGIQSEGGGPQAYLLLEDVETTHNRRQGIFWNSLAGVQHLTLRRVQATYTAEGANTTANGAGRGFFLVNGQKVAIVVENSVFSFNRRSGVDVNDGSVSDLTVRNCRFEQNDEPALAVLGAGGARTSGSYTGPAALIEGNRIIASAASGLELKSCTGTGLGSGPGSLVVRGNTITRPAGAPASLTADKAGILFIDRDRNVIAGGGGVTGNLVTGGAYLTGNTVRGFGADAASSAANNNGFGMVLEGANNKVFGNVVAQCQHAIQVQDRPANSTGATPFFDISRNGFLASSGDSIRGNRLDSCAVTIRAVNLTNPVEASLNWLGTTEATEVRGPAGLGGRVVNLGGPAAGFAEQSALAPAGLVDYSPFLNSAAAASATVGFQTPLDYLNIDHASPSPTAATPLAEGLALVAENGTLRLSAAAYAESISLTKSLTLQPTGATSLRDLTLAGAGKVLTLSAPLTLTGALTLTAGLVHTTATALLTLADKATATAGNATSYVDGPLRKVGQQAFEFPLGKGGQWARLGISAPASATTSFTAEYVAAAHPTRSAASPLSEVSQVEYWTLDGAGTPDAVQVRLFWENAFRSGLDDFSADIQVATLAGAQWQTAGNGGLGGNLGAGSVVSAQAVGSGTYTLGSLSPAVNPLSTQLQSFAASQPSPQVVDLKWTLSDETNTYGYAVERSAAPAAAANWQQVGFVASQGLTTQARTYTYRDQTVQGLSQAYYRLRQTTPTAATRYSGIAAVALVGSPLATTAATTAELSVFPNPARGQVTVQLPAAGSGQIVLTDLSGRTVLTQPLAGGTKTTVTLPASLGTGIYLLKVQGAGAASKPQRLVVQ